MQGDKLFIRGKASSEDAKNKVKGWELISRKGNVLQILPPTVCRRR